jgi:choline dehydrogenase-like flavoprotein
MSVSDFLVIGGGLAGSVIASRLAEAFPSSSITVVEAGADESANPLCAAPLACFGAHHSPLDWAYTTAPQKHLGGRRCYASAGKALGGSTATNYGTWMRAPKIDYDAWRDMIGDERWGYHGLLPFFRRTERHFAGAPAEHGGDGPIWTASISSSSKLRRYGLRESVEKAWSDAGVQHIADFNAGSNLGFSEAVENWRQGKRQIASEAYGLKHHANITVATNQLVSRVLISTSPDGSKVATGAETSDGTMYSASKEVIVSCGAYRSPQLLLLSGIGPTDELANHGIQQHVELPVGRNFHDHPSLNQFWKISQPERGLSMGTPLWTDPAYQLGLPCDFIAFRPGPDAAELAEAQDLDEQKYGTDAPVGDPERRQRAWARGVTSRSSSGTERSRIETFNHCLRTRACTAPMESHY